MIDFRLRRRQHAVVVAPVFDDPTTRFPPSIESIQAKHGVSRADATAAWWFWRSIAVSYALEAATWEWFSAPWDWPPRG